MHYPDNYDIPAFPAGARIAVSRAAAICIAVVMALIVFICGMLIWVVPGQRVHPFLISAENGGAGAWRIVGHDHGARTVTALQSIQESLVSKYVRARFHISQVAMENDIAWMGCERSTDCHTTGNSTNGASCAMFCASTDEVFETFVTNVVPEYRMRAAAGERWMVNINTLRMRPSDSLSNNGGTWRVNFTVTSNMAPPIRVIAYVKVARNINAYPSTLGFYIADFNSYRLDI